MQGEANIDYKIKQASKYQQEKSFNHKQLKKINQKSHNFQFGSLQEKFEIELGFKPAIITAIEFKVKQTNQISFDLFNKGERICNFQTILTKQQIGVIKTKYIKLEDQAQIFDKVVVTFLNYDTPKKTIINYIFLKGFKQDKDKKTQHKVKNVSQKDEFELPSKKKVTDEDKKLFNTRNKERATLPSQLIEDAMNFKGNKQDEQLKRVLQQSKKEHQRQLKQKKQQKQKQKKSGDDDVVQIFPGPADEEQQNYQQFFEYDVVQYEKVKNVFEHVTPQWIQAQRKAQYNLNIQSRHSLADKIKIKIFKQHTFCINNIAGEVKSRLIQAIKNLGGKIIQQPTNKCIVVTNKMQGGKINLAKTLAGVTFVKPNYIHDCQKMKVKIQDMQQYKPS